MDKHETYSLYHMGKEGKQITKEQFDLISGNIRHPEYENVMSVWNRSTGITFWLMKPIAKWV